MEDLTTEKVQPTVKGLKSQKQQAQQVLEG
jgi:hypothetical protein